MYTVKGLEGSRTAGFRPKDIFGHLLKEFLGLSDGQKILDLGCGTGFFTRIIADNVNADITGIDINETLLDGAKQIAKEQNLNIKFEQGDITKVKYYDNTFDVVMCDIMLECFSDITVPLKEMKRVCKKGGTIAAIEPFYQGSCKYYPEMDKETQDLHLKYSRSISPYGVGPSLPYLFNNIGLLDIDLISWFWGSIGYKTLDYTTVDSKLKSMEKNLEIIKQHIEIDENFSLYERNKIIYFYESRLNYFKQNPSKLREDMSVSGLPVFIVKGTKPDDSVNV